MQVKGHEYESQHLDRSFIGYAIKEGHSGHRKDSLAAEEAMLVGSAVGVQGIISWDGRQVGDGRVGPATSFLAELLLDDMRSI